MSFVDKKEKFAGLIEEYMVDSSKENELLSLINDFLMDGDFSDKALFLNMFNELKTYLTSLSRKELKQRVLMIRSFD
ncbi:MAG: hypothetical protein KC589_05945 [Nanoarchaeota archaeon]|nr:hypothetical protein [Nanoarchaeota archaeon]